ncbi:hypothetical protein DSLASN_31790 [Desulfoluna limicola]|uniref:Uncharacterized protein n=1 Tax=Desulfoluna limicola TaxID=2810562 RepID=A0ABM7PJ17_9BACT|nr:BTAD domain-containing putative transcriptional regulator [Desulfoluna limicola]BCS97547.1 hypothetical protein DSLASN_31790 [Desulfoluna limicola]
MALISDTVAVPGLTKKHYYIRSTVLHTISLRSFEKNRSVLIEAQAGQGKTTLARQYLAHVSSPGVWYPLSPDDNDAVVLIDRLYSLLRQSVKGFSSRLIATMLAKGEITYKSMGKYARILLADVKKALKEDLYIVFDDIHLIETSPAPLKFLEAFVSEPPHNLHFILISRHRIPRQVRAAFQSSRCVYLDTKALAFSKKEARELIHGVMEIPLSRRQLNQLYETTGGWIMGLRSTCIALQTNGTSTTALGQQLQGNAELDFQYFAEEVYPWMEPVVTAPVLKLALLDDIPLRLAEQVCEDEKVSEKLTYLCRNNFFLSQVGNHEETFAFHHLFRDFLRGKCRQQFRGEEIADFLNRASHWYAEENQLEKALSCLLRANNHDGMEALMERRGMESYRLGHLYCIHLILKQIPPPAIESRCWLSFFLGLLSIELEPTSAIHYLNVSRNLFASRGNPQGELLATAELCFNHIYIDGQLDSGKALFPRASELFKRLGESLDPFYKARTASALATANFYYFGDTDTAEAYSALVKETARAHDMRNILAESHATSCFNHMGRGRFTLSAEEIDALHPCFADPRVNDSTKFIGRVAQLNQLEITGDFFNYAYMKSIAQQLTGTELIQNSVLQGFTTVWDTCQSLADGDTDRALQLIHGALVRDEASQSPHLRSQFYHYQAFIYGVTQNAPKAIEAASRSIELRQMAQAPYFTTLQAMILGAMYVQLNMPDQAEEFLAKALEGSNALKETFIRCGALSHRSFMHLQCGNKDAALRDTRELLTLMQKERYTHFDSWMPRVMLPVLRFAHQHGVSPQFVRKLASMRLNVSFDEEHTPLPILAVTTLGKFTLKIGDSVILDGTHLSQNEQRLLSAIICAPAMSISIHEAFDMFWPESNEEKALKALNVMFFRLRKKISPPPEAPAFEFQDYLQHKNKQLFLTHCRIDAHEFQASVTRGLTQFKQRQPWQASNSFRYALSLWKGSFLKSIDAHDVAGEYNDRYFLNTLGKAATCWSTIIKENGDCIREDLDLIERTVHRGAGTPEMMKNLLDIHAASGDTRKIQHLTHVYQDALLRAGYTREEMEEEIEGLWAHESKYLAN